jgi:cystathionine beta-lyase
MHGAMEVLRAQQANTVVINPPVYPPYFEYLTHTGHTIVEAPLEQGPLQQGRLDLDELERAFRDAPAGHTSYFLCSPHNPTGTVHTADELRAVAGLAKEHGVAVVVDEIHGPLVYDDAFVPYLAIDDGAVVLMSASKAWNLPGLKAALAVAGPVAAEVVTGFPELVWMGASHFGVLSHTAAYTHGQPWLDDLLAGLDENRRLLGALLEEHLPEVGYTMPEGTYLAWLDCRPLGLGDDPAQPFLERGRVALNSGLPFGAGGTGFVRLNFATHPDILAEAVRRMAACR